MSCAAMCLPVYMRMNVRMYVIRLAGEGEWVLLDWWHACTSICIYREREIYMSVYIYVYIYICMCVHVYIHMC